MMHTYISQLPPCPMPAHSANGHPDTPNADWADLWPRPVAIMGSTGSIGVNALRVMARHPERFTVIALAGARNSALLARQARVWRPPYLGTLNEKTREELRALLPPDYTPEICIGAQGYAALASLAEVRLVLCAQVGAAGIHATAAAVRSGKVIALANKESLVLAGDILRTLCATSAAVILPVDSEHNAIFQCLHGYPYAAVQRLIVTASGGPFRGRNTHFLETATPEMALAHPNWSMGAKISIDSATMMNKGLELIEAHHLYGLPLGQIDVLVHPQSVVHSMVEFTDGSVLAQAGPADMRLPIGHCLCWPQRVDSGADRLNLTKTQPLHFEEPDTATFPCLSLARQALAGGQGLPIVLNAANEVAVARFLERKIRFTEIAKMVDAALNAHTAGAPETLEETLDLDAQTRCRLAV